MSRFAPPCGGLFTVCRADSWLRTKLEVLVTIVQNMVHQHPSTS